MLTVRVGEELKFKARNTDGAVLCTIQVPNGDDGHGSIGFDPLNDAQVNRTKFLHCLIFGSINSILL